MLINLARLILLARALHARERQPPPANWYWAWILAIVLIAVVATAVVYLRKPEALERAGTVGPEYVHDEE